MHNFSSIKVLITQSNYIPWKGFFDLLQVSDIFVVFDEMQYTKRDWRNRNLIKTDVGLKWLTIPVETKGKYFQKINETKISDYNWNKKHWALIKSYYSKASCFNEVSNWIENLYMDCKFTYISEINIYFIKAICKYLNIKIDIRLSSEFKLLNDKTNRLVEICTELNATDYYTGPSSKNYLDESKFELKNIKVKYFDYSNYPEYTQLYNGFFNKVSILDLIFNQGKSSSKFLKHTI